MPDSTIANTEGLLPLERLDPKNDWFFKVLLSSPGNEDLLVDLLNSVFNPPEPQRISTVVILNPIKIRGYKDDKEAVMDIHAVTNNGTQITIEMQMSNEHDMKKRALYYWAITFAQQMKRSMGYVELQRTVGINLLNFDLFGQTTQHHTMFSVREATEGFLLDDTEEIHFIELPKMLAKWRNGELDTENDPMAGWFMIFEANEDPEIERRLEQMANTSTVINKARREMERLSQDPVVRQRYFDRQKAEIDRLAKNRAEVLNGEARGEERGLENGIRETLWEQAQEKWVSIPADIPDWLAQQDMEQLKALRKKLLHASTPEEWRQIPN